MGARDHLKIPARSADRGSGTEPRLQHEVAGIAHVLALQRALGNRATSQLLSSRRLPGAVLQRTLRGEKNVVSGRKSPHGKGPLDEARGRQLMEEFARNDQRSVADLDNVPEDVVANPNVAGDTPSLDQQEWGLIKEEGTGEVHLIKGEKGSVEWGPYVEKGGTLLAHSHPWRSQEQELMPAGTSVSLDDLVPPPTEQPAPAVAPPPVGGERQAPAQPGRAAVAPPGGGERQAPAQPGTAVAPPPASGQRRRIVRITADDMKRREEAKKIGGPKMAILPTVSDFTYPATKGQKAHTVFTPYVLDHAKGTVRPPTDQNDAPDQRLTWELTDIQLDRNKRVVTGNLAATSRAAARDETKNWKHRVQAPIGDFGSLEGETSETQSPMKTGPLRSVGYTRID